MMMRFATAAALFSSVQYFAEAKVSMAKLPETLSHEHAEAVGQAHTEAFDMLTKKYSTQRPQSKDEMMQDLGEIMASFCDDETTKKLCTENAHKHGDNYAVDEVAYPDTFDTKLLMLVDDIYTTLNTLQDDNLDEVLMNLNDIKNKIMAMDVDPVHKHAALSGAHVAIESTKLWTTVYKNGKHPLFGLHHSTYFGENAVVGLGDEAKVELDSMHGNHRRQLQLNNCIPPTTPGHNNDYYDEDRWIWIPGWGWVWNPIGGGDGASSETNAFSRFNIIDIIGADIDGAFFGVFEEAQANPVVVLTATLFFQYAFQGATARSAVYAVTPPSPAPTKTPSMAPTVSCSPTNAPTKLPTKAPTTNATATAP